MAHAQQEPAQADPPPADHPPSTVTSSPHSPPANNAIDVAKRVPRQPCNMELYNLSKSFGPIPNVPVFTHWLKRKDCSASAVHRQVMAGIHGTSKEGVYAISLSGLYEDDEDGGDVIIYTGTGGRQRWTDSDPPKRILFGPQIKDQSWDHPSNKALMVSLCTGNPIRLIRSWKCPSQYAPTVGYRYDGLYKVAACWTAKGRCKKQICRCRLERLPDQPPIPTKQITLSASRRRRARLVTGLPPTSSSSSDPCGISDGIDADMTLNPPDTSAGVSSNKEEFNSDIELSPPLPPQQLTPPTPSALPRYRWDSKNHVLARVTDFL